MRLLAQIGIALVLAMGIAACGGGSDSGSVSAPPNTSAKDAAQVEALAARFAGAVRHRNAKAFCRLLAPSAKARLGGFKRCLVVWGRGKNPIFAAAHTRLGLVEITKLKVPIAVARLADGGHLAFVQEGGTWYVNLGPGGHR